MQTEITTNGAPKPLGEEPRYADFFDDDGEPHEWPGPDAAMVFEGNGYEQFLPKSHRRDSGETTLLQLSYMFDDDLGREFRDEHRDADPDPDSTGPSWGAIGRLAQQGVHHVG